MAFDEVQFPTGISYGSKGGPGYRTDVVRVDSGAEQRSQRWSNALRQYDASYGVKTPADLNALIAFFMARKGSQYGFRYKDWLDFTSAADKRSAPANTDQSIGVGDGTVKQFQLVKRYGDVRTEIRNITKPVASTTVVALDGVNQTSGWTVNTTTGIVTFTTAPGSDVEVTAGFEFDVPVRFGEAADQVLQMSWDDFGSGSIPNGVPLVEIRDGLTVLDDFFMGGAVELAISANTAISLAAGRVQVFNPSTTLVILLPDEDDIAPGGPIFYLVNEGSHTLTIKNSTGVTTIGTLTAGSAVEVILSVDGSGTKIWYLI